VTQDFETNNNIAPLENVVLLRALVNRCEGRAGLLPGLGCFYGPAGHGKTTAAIHAVNVFHAVHVEVFMFGGVKKLLEDLAGAMGLTPERTVTKLFEQVTADLSMTRRPVLIDEADKAKSEGMLDTIRKIHDVAQVPVILIGEEVLPQRLAKYERVHGRILAWVRAEESTLDDVRYLAPIYAKGLTVKPDLLARVHKVSRGSVRYASTNLALIAEFCRSRGLGEIGLSDWGDRALHSGEAPAPRKVRA
jgi:DNA transposition AAA+ family ATPase